MNHPVKPVVLWALAVGVAVSVALAAKLTFDKRRLTAVYTQARAEIAQLSQELGQARQTIDTQADDFGALEQELTRIQTRLNLADQDIARLQQEQVAMKEENQTLNEQLTAASAEQQALRARLSSLTELKIAVREVKARVRQERWEAWLAYVRAQRADDQQRLAKGNRGFVVRNGVPTIGAPTRLQVRVLEPQASP